MTNDPTRPAHYSPDSIEAIAAMKAWMPPEMFAGFLHGNVLKYASRLAKKGAALEDAKKARRYLDWLIQELGQESDHTHPITDFAAQPVSDGHPGVDYHAANPSADFAAAPTTTPPRGHEVGSRPTLAAPFAASASAWGAEVAGKMSLRRVLAAVIAERQRQDAKWGEQNHTPEKWFVILAEEFGEVARAIYEGDLKHAQTELVEVAAVAVAMMQSMERNQGVMVEGDASADPLSQIAQAASDLLANVLNPAATAYPSAPKHLWDYVAAALGQPPLPEPQKPKVSSQAVINRIGSRFGYALNGPNEGELCEIMTAPAWDGKYVLMRPDAPDEMFPLTDAPEGEVYFLGVASAKDQPHNLRDLVLIADAALSLYENRLKYLIDWRPLGKALRASKEDE